MSSDKEKYEKLSIFLQTAINQSKQVHYKLDQDKCQLINQIYDELQKKDKSLDILNIWVDIIQEFLNKAFLEKNKSSQQILVKIINLIPWFQTESHLCLFPKYSKLVLSLISFQQLYATLSLKILIQNLLPINSEIQSKVSILGEDFDNKESLISRIRDILQSVQIDGQNFKVLNEKDQQFMLEIFKNHHDANQRLSEMQEILIGKTVQGTQCFFIKNKNSNEEISYLKTVDSIFQKIKFDFKISSFEQNKFDNIIKLLQKILKIYPLSQKIFLELLKENYPYKKSSEDSLFIYQFNAIKIGLTVPQLMESILNISIQNLILIDVEVKQNDKNELFYLNDEMARKIDNQLLIIIDLINLSMNQKTIFFSKDQCFDKKKLFFILLDIFDKKLLTINQTQYVQFFMFYFCSFGQEYVEKFLSVLITTLTDQQSTKCQKINSLSYISSFLTRANYVNQDFVNQCLEIMIDQLEKQRDLLEIKCEKEYFYNFCQIYIYIVGLIYNDLYSDKFQQLMNQFFQLLDENQKNQIFQIISNKNLTAFLAACKINNYDFNYDNSSKVDKIKINLQYYFPFDTFKLFYCQKYIGQYQIERQSNKLRYQNYDYLKQTNVPSEDTCYTPRNKQIKLN